MRDIVVTDRQLTIAAMCGNAGAGGVFLALGADHVYARDGVILNPHYKGMGNLYGSEYWTYLLPRRVGPRSGARARRKPAADRRARAAALGLIDGHFGPTPTAFRAEIARARQCSPRIRDSPECSPRRTARRAADESAKPLAAYRDAELERMRLSFYGFDSSYHVARFNFVQKVPRSRTPLFLAPHRIRTAGRAPAFAAESP